jgi:autotransporter-associated beta strand protein
MGTGPEIVSVGHNTWGGNPNAIRQHVVLPTKRREFMCEYVSQVGSGTLVLNGANTFTGATSITGGRLTVDAGGRINSTSGITVNGSGAELKYNSSTALSQPLTITQGTLSGTGSAQGSASFKVGAQVTGQVDILKRYTGPFSLPIKFTQTATKPTFTYTTFTLTTLGFRVDLTVTTNLLITANIGIPMATAGVTAGFDVVINP